MAYRTLLIGIMCMLFLIAPAALAQQLALTDDFESGEYQWTLNEGWSLIELEDSNQVLKGINHAWARSEADGVVFKYVARIKIETGTLQMGFRLSEDSEGPVRYFVGLNADGQSTNIQKQTGSDDTIEILKHVQRGVSANEWHDITIWMDGNRINVHVDDVLMIWAKDEGELITTGGGVHFETLDNSIAYVDDIMVEVLEPEDMPIETPVYSKPPNVLTKRVSSGVIGQSDGEIVFEVSNEDPNHNLQGYLTCDIPSDMVVTSAMGAATGEQVQYISQKFIIDPAPGSESMSLRLSSAKPGDKYIRCTVNYVLYSEEKGYISIGGQYSSNIKYQEITVNRDVSFLPGELVDEPGSKDTGTDRNMVYALAAIAALAILFLVYKVGTLSAQKKK